LKLGRVAQPIVRETLIDASMIGSAEVTFRANAMVAEILLSREEAREWVQQVLAAKHTTSDRPDDHLFVKGLKKPRLRGSGARLSPVNPICLKRRKAR
jgi:hypothetical protein